MADVGKILLIVHLGINGLILMPGRKTPAVVQAITSTMPKVPKSHDQFDLQILELTKWHLAQPFLQVNFYLHNREILPVLVSEQLNALPEGDLIQISKLLLRQPGIPGDYQRTAEITRISSEKLSV